MVTMLKYIFCPDLMASTVRAVWHCKSLSFNVDFYRVKRPTNNRYISGRGNTTRIELRYNKYVG